MKGIIKKADIILAIVLVAVCGLVSYIAYGIGDLGNKVVITVDGRVYGTYQLDEDKTVDVDTDLGHNQVTIEDGRARMTEADCPDGYCMEQYKSDGGIDKSNQTIVCLPHKVVVSIESDDSGSGPDAVTGLPVEIPGGSADGQ